MRNSPAMVHSIESIDRQLATSVRSLRFEGAAEAQYASDTGADRMKYLPIVTLIGLIIYDIFLLSDWQMVPDVFHQALILRLGVFTPATLICLTVMTRSRTASIREGLGAFVCVLSVIPILILFSLSTCPTRLTYHYGTMIIIMFVTVVQRVRFHYAVTAVCGMLIFQLVAISRCDAFNAAMIQSEGIFYISTSVLILGAAYMLEREERRSYLLVLRGRLLNEQLERAAEIDPLTGLWNRRHLNGMLTRVWIEAEFESASMAIVLVDVDYFKLFNDTCGHLEGDQCLTRIGASLQSTLADTGGTAFRFGGEEFMVLLPGCDLARALAATQRLREALLQEAIPHRALGAGAIVTASFGVAAGQTADVSAAALMAAADQALYTAKRTGRDRISAVAETLAPAVLDSAAA